jgi:hypothetical protein
MPSAQPVSSLSYYKYMLHCLAEKVSRRPTRISEAYHQLVHLFILGGEKHQLALITSLHYSSRLREKQVS